MLYFFLGLFLFVLFLAIFLIYKFSKKTKLSKDKKQKFLSHLKKIKSSNSAKEQIIDYDKLYHSTLNSLGHEGNFGEILKKNPKEIVDIDKIWSLHKLRNKLVHDFDLISEGKLKKRALEYEAELKKILK